jgi:virulence factor
MGEAHLRPTERGPAVKTARIAFVGAGEMANAVHYPSLKSFSDVEIVGLCDIDESRLQSTAQRWGIARQYTDYRQMLTELQPNGVYVIGLPHIMFDIWVWCLQQGHNLYIEKPMGLTRHQAEVLATLAEEHGCITQVSHQRRTSPLLRQMKDACTAHGPITHAVCEFYKFSPEPMLGARDRMMDDGVHAIDTLRWMCGGEVIGLDSDAKRIGHKDINWLASLLYFDNGSTGALLCNWASGRRVFRVEMHSPGAACDAEVEGKAFLYERGDYNGKCYDAKEVAGSDQLFVYGGFQAKNREFIDSILEGKEMTSSPFRDTLKTIEVAEAILAQTLLKEKSWA